MGFWWQQTTMGVGGEMDTLEWVQAVLPNGVSNPVAVTKKGLRISLQISLNPRAEVYIPKLLGTRLQIST